MDLNTEARFEYSWELEVKEKSSRGEQWHCFISCTVQYSTASFQAFPVISASFE